MTPLTAPEHLTGPAEVQIYPHGATLTQWTPTGQQPVIFLSSAAIFSPDSPIRGGVPICFPWFGPGRNGALAPLHGPARTTEWRRVPIAGPGASDGRVNADAVSTAYEIGEADIGDCPAFPHPFHARYEVTAGAALQLRLTVTNTGEADIDFEDALHTYLVVAEVEQIALLGLEDTAYIDKTANKALITASGKPIVLRGEVDRVYQGAPGVRVLDPVLRRVLVITSEGAANTVVWNPGPAKAATITDLAPDEWAGFVCVEAANALADAVRLAPGQSHTLGYRIEIEPLA